MITVNVFNTITGDNQDMTLEEWEQYILSFGVPIHLGAGFEGFDCNCPKCEGQDE